MIRYEEIAPAREKEEPEEEPAQEPETARLLDESVRFFDDHLSADEVMLRVLTLFSGATWAMPEAFVTFPRLLFASRKPGLEGKNSGKTTGMNVTASLCANPRNAKGSPAALRAKLFRAAQLGNSVVTFFYDQIDGVYGLLGTNRGGNQTLTSFLQEGYKLGPTDSISRQGTDFEFSLFHPMIMTANAMGMPSDIFQRCIVVYMNAGIPRRYFSVRESGKEAANLAAALGAAVRANLTAIGEFRARGIHPKLDQRLLEVWEPLFAVAYVLGGQRWLNWCLDAFAAIGLDAEENALSNDQQVLRDSVSLLDKVMITLPNEREFAEGIALATELKDSFRKNGIYSTKTPMGIARMISNAMPSFPKQVRIGEQRINGYYVDDVRAAWDAVKPPELADARVMEEENPFAVTAVSDSEFDEVFEIEPQPAPVRVSGQSARKRTVVK